ncbi:uncharacterized protein LOC125241050 isoform X2 [Leguminivora glycinivorella]|uniref:uncharacterized protein LOC125241050 isoform X2 n=1 Tax=Leguminivora glycinivorella TaxID=1035111 RepID=UPI00200C82A0|nr:uncharacterized protein LOC125241050 isoform X2 [Leguminivora glycinivorella]
MGICKRLQKATLVSSFDQILLRLKEQTYQTERLMMQLRQNSLKRNALLENRKHGTLMLDMLKNVGQENTKAYVEEKNLIKAQLQAEKGEEAALIRSLNDKGQLIIKMKTSLQQINQLLSSVGAPNAPRSGPPPSAQYKLVDYIQPVAEVEADFEKLLATAKQKIGVLVGALAKMDVSPADRLAANLFYHNILARFMRDNYKEEVVAEGGLIEFEMDDPNVPGHAVIKLRSKQLVEAQVSEFDVPDTKK